MLLLLLASLAAGEASFQGLRVHYTNYGAGSTAVVLIHGWTCDESFWQYQVPALRARHRVITIDLPGHGRSEVPAEREMTMDNFARAIDAVLQEAGVSRAILAGHSMGTPVIRQFARLFPGKTAGLVLMDGTIFRPQDAAARQGRGQIYAGEEGGRKRLSVMRAYFGPATSPAVRQQIERVSGATAEATAVGAINGMLALAVWQDESPVRVPALAVYQGQPGVSVDYLRQLFPLLRYHRVAGTGHFLMMEKPEKVNPLLVRFVDRVFGRR